MGPVRTDRPVKRRFGPLGWPMCHDRMGAGRTKATHSTDIDWEQVHTGCLTKEVEDWERGGEEEEELFTNKPSSSTRRRGGTVYE